MLEARLGIDLHLARTGSSVRLQGIIHPADYLVKESG